MSRRSPQESWESYADRLIREAQERGEFDDLPGKGKPLTGIDTPPDELWWVRDLLRREGVVVTPPTLALRKAREDLLAGIAAVPDEATVRRLVAELNDRIRHANRIPSAGPPSTLTTVDEDDVVERWREARSVGGG